MKRTDYLGASETGAIMTGCDEYGRTPLTIYCEKLGLKDKKESEILQRGNDLEPIIFDKYIKDYDETVTGWLYQPTAFDEPWVNPDIPWLGCHPDAKNGSVGLLEIKLISSEWTVDGDDPQEWLKVNHPSKYWQCQTMLAITGYMKVILFPWVNNQFTWHGLPPIEILPNKEDIKSMLEKTYDFWYNNIQKQTPPEVVEVQKPELKSDYVETDKDTLQAIQDYATMIKQQKQLETATDAIKGLLKARYSKTDHKTIQAGNVRLKANWKLGASRLSKERLIAQGVDLTNCYERGNPVYILEVEETND